MRAFQRIVINNGCDERLARGGYSMVTNMVGRAGVARFFRLFCRRRIKFAARSRLAL